jgi:hypothetical protein
MNDRTKLILEHLEDMIEDAECGMTGTHSIVDYGMKVRRDTAEEILRFVQSLSRSAATGTSRHASMIPTAHPSASTRWGGVARSALPQPAASGAAPHE